MKALVQALLVLAAAWAVMGQVVDFRTGHRLTAACTWEAHHWYRALGYSGAPEARDLAAQALCKAAKGLKSDSPDVKFLLPRWGA